MYTLNSVALPRPKAFKREFIPVREDFTAISGKSLRDYRLLNKERFTLGWEILSPAELTTLTGIVALNTAVPFAVSETNLTVNATQVLTRLNYLRYEIIGGDYFAQAELVLTEA